MGNNYSVEFTQRRRNTIEIIMADDQDDKPPNDFTLQLINDKNISCNSLNSIISITSSTQTEPDLFTQWPKQRFVFKWMNKFKNYPLLLLKSQQMLNLSHKIHDSVLHKETEVRSISLSTQTINKINDHVILSNLSLFKTKVCLNNIFKEMNHNKIYDSNEFLKKSSENSSEINDEIIYRTETSDTNDNSNKENIENNEKIILYNDNSINKNEVIHKIKKPRLMSNDTILSQLSNDFYRNEIKPNKRKSIVFDNTESSSESLTSVTWLSKQENSSLIYKSNAKSYKNSRKRNKKNKEISCHTLNENIKLGLRTTNKNNFNDIQNNKINKYHNICQKKAIRKNKNRKTNELSKNKADFSVIEYENDNNEKSFKSVNIRYKFWISANIKNWSIFHNYEDRRIESIGRLSQCRIELTNMISRQSNGMLKQKVIIYAPSHSALEKCCKLFDDKFPEFYATARLLKALYYRKGGTFKVSNEYRQFISNDNRVVKQKSRKRKVNREINVSTDLGFLRNTVNGLQDI